VPDHCALVEPKGPVGFQNSATVVDLGFLRGPLIFVEEAAKYRSALDPHLREVGDRGGILITSMPASARTASNDALNCPARSRIKNRKQAARSPRSISRLRTCCAVHRPSGLAVTPRMCTDREPTSITNKT